MPRTSNKRERLLAAAKELIHRQGFARTTLSDIASSSGVPLGNVYYYFKTKDDIGSAVIHDRMLEFEALYETWNRLPDPLARLDALLDMPQEMSEVIAQYGCPIGGLAQELNKQDSALARESATLVRRQIDWVTGQFEQLGCPEARELAIYLLATLQGIILYASTLNDAGLVSREIQRLRQWIRAQAAACQDY